jgi:hypothetical protein
MTKRLFSLCIFCSIVISCSHENQYKYSNHAKKYGLRESIKYSDLSELMENAIFYTNALLGSDVRMRLQYTWKKSILRPRYEFSSDVKNEHNITSIYIKDKDIVIYHNAKPIPVYLIDDEHIGLSENFFVPENEECIFVNIKYMNALFDYFRVMRYGGKRDGGYMRPEAMMVATIFLHEIGHLYYGDSGSYTAPAYFKKDDLASPSKNIINKEVRADKFAVEQITNAFENKPTEDFVRDSAGITNNFIAWDMLRTIFAAARGHEIENDPFGIFDGKLKPTILSSSSYSHPNIYLRLYIMEYLLSKEKSVELQENIDFNKREELISKYMNINIK